MPRPVSPDLQTNWKLSLPATTAGKVEFLLFDTVHNKPKYGARNKLVTALLEKWIAEQERTGTEIAIPTAAELRSA